MPDEVWRRQHAIVEQMMRALMECPMPVIAAVNGAAYAGGMEIALGCDFIYAAQSARFALTEVTLGHHARRRRHAEPAARGRRAPRQGADPDGHAVHGARRRWRGAWSTRCAPTTS